MFYSPPSSDINPPSRNLIPHLDMNCKCFSAHPTTSAAIPYSATRFLLSASFLGTSYGNELQHINFKACLRQEHSHAGGCRQIHVSAYVALCINDSKRLWSEKVVSRSNSLEWHRLWSQIGSNMIIAWNRLEWSGGITMAVAMLSPLHGKLHQGG